jgi:hypothetical protein
MIFKGRDNIDETLLFLYFTPTHHTTLTEKKKTLHRNNEINENIEI